MQCLGDWLATLGYHGGTLLTVKFGLLLLVESGKLSRQAHPFSVASFALLFLLNACLNLIFSPHNATDFLSPFRAGLRKGRASDALASVYSCLLIDILESHFVASTGNNVLKRLGSFWSFKLSCDFALGVVVPVSASCFQKVPCWPKITFPAKQFKFKSSENHLRDKGQTQEPSIL